MNHSFDKDIAVAYGLAEAVILNHMQFWIEQNQANNVNFYDGSFWTYNTTKAYAEIFPYLSQRQIQCALKHLREEGILKTGNYNKSAYDRTLWYAFTEKGISIMQKCKMENTEMSNGFDLQVQPIPDNNTYNNTDIKPNKKKTKKGFDAVVEEYTTNADLKAAIIDFIQFRKAIKAPLTDRALTLCLNKLDKLANNDLEKIAILNQSIERGWKGLFEVKDNVSYHRPTTSENNAVPSEDDYDFERGSFWK